MSPALASSLLDLALSPSGRLRLAASDTAIEIEPVRLARLLPAFERGPGDGLVQLGGAELEGDLPPALGWFREFGRLFFTALCALPDLDLPGALDNAPPAPDFDELARSAAPMLGGEYLNAAVLESLWGATWDALSARAGGIRDPRSKDGRQTLSSHAGEQWLSAVFGIELERAPAQPAARATVRPSQAKRAEARPSLEPKNSSRDVAPGSRARALARERALVPKHRSASDVTETTALVLAFITSHPGVGVELIGQQLGLSTRQLSLPIRKLTAMGSIVSAGLKRATKYFKAPQPPRRPRARS